MRPYRLYSGNLYIETEDLTLYVIAPFFARRLPYFNSNTLTITFNSSLSSVANMREWIGPNLIQIMACRLFGAKSLSKQMLVYCQLDR